MNKTIEKKNILYFHLSLKWRYNLLFANDVHTYLRRKKRKIKQNKQNVDRTWLHKSDKKKKEETDDK